MTRSALHLTSAFLAGFFIWSIVNPHIFLAIVFFTAGLAVPLAFLNTVLVYFLAAWPALTALTTKPYNWRLIACSAVLIPLVAVVPPLISKVLTFSHMQRLLSDDVSMGFPGIPKSIEVVGEGRPGPYFMVLPSDAPCLDLCQRLLLSRQVDVVRVMRAKGPGGFDYRLERRDSCPDAFPSTRLMLSRTRDLFVSGTCFVAQESDSTAMAARIEIRKTSFPDIWNLLQALPRMADMVRNIQVLTISMSEQGSPRLRRTKVTFWYWRMPLIVGLVNFGSVERTLNDFDLDQFALQALGIGEHDPGEQLTPIERVTAVLDHGGKSLTGIQEEIIAEWLHSLPPCNVQSKPPGKAQTCPPLAREDEEMLKRLVGDRRVSPFGIAEVVSRYPDFATDHLDLLLDQMETRGANSDFTNVMGAVMARLDIDKLRSRRDRILPLIRNNDWTRQSQRGIGLLSGRLGIDTTDLILQRLRQRATAGTAAVAACMADAAVGQQLVPALLDYLRESTARGFPDRYAMKALTRFGHLEAIKEITGARFPELAEHYAQRKRDVDKANDISLCDPE